MRGGVRGRGALGAWSLCLGLGRAGARPAACYQRRNEPRRRARSVPTCLIPPACCSHAWRQLALIVAAQAARCAHRLCSLGWLARLRAGGRVGAGQRAVVGVPVAAAPLLQAACMVSHVAAGANARRGEAREYQPEPVCLLITHSLRGSEGARARRHCRPLALQHRAGMLRRPSRPAAGRRPARAPSNLFFGHMPDAA